MRILFALATTALALLSTAPSIVGAQAATAKYDNPQQKVSFEYPTTWTIVPNTPRGVLANEFFTVQARGDATTEFDVALYRLAAPLTEDNFDQQMQALDQAMAAYVAKLPGGSLQDSGDIVVDDADGRVYNYEFTLNGVLMYAETTIVIDNDVAAEISQIATDDEYGDKQEFFNDIFASLYLPWTPI